MSQDTDRGSAVPCPESEHLQQRPCQYHHRRNHCSGAHQARPRGDQSIDRAAAAGSGRSAVRRVVHRGSQGRDRLGTKKLPIVGSKSHGFGIAVLDAAQLSHFERQRPDGRRTLDRGICVVDREFAESNHRQDPVAHARDDGRIAQLGGRAAAAGGAAGNRPAKFPAGRSANGARIHIRRWPRSGTGKGKCCAGRPYGVGCEQCDLDLGRHVGHDRYACGCARNRSRIGTTACRAASSSGRANGSGAA